MEHLEYIAVGLGLLHEPFFGFQQQGVIFFHLGVYPSRLGHITSQDKDFAIQHLSTALIAVSDILCAPCGYTQHQEQQQ